MERRRRRRPTLALALMVSLGARGWSVAGAVNVGDTAVHCTNVTTVEVYESNTTSTAAAEITTAACDQVVVKVQTTDDGAKLLDLRRQGIRVVESLPVADVVCVSASNAGCAGEFELTARCSQYARQQPGPVLRDWEQRLLAVGALFSRIVVACGR